MELVFKIAEESDTDRLLEFMRDFYEYDRIRFDAGLARAALEGIINDGSRGRVWLIQLGGEPVGYAVTRFLMSFTSSRLIAGKG
jgi:hypothetical protein